MYEHSFKHKNELNNASINIFNYVIIPLFK